MSIVRRMISMDNLQTSIQWADFTLNLWRGCYKADDDCLYCYFYRDMNRLGHNGRDIVKISYNTIRSKIKAANNLLAKRKAAGDPTPVRIFCFSWADVFMKEVAQEWRDELWQIARKNPELIFMVLTKRPELIPSGLPSDWGSGYPNVWLGTSIGSNTNLKRIRVLDLLKVNAVVHFLSIEPLHGEGINLRHIDAEADGDKDWIQVDVLTGEQTDMARPCADIPNKISWVIVGGESGNETGKYKYRPCELEWLVSIVDQCRSAKVPVFVKQLGTHLAKRYELQDRHGGNPEEWPMKHRLNYQEHPAV
jgi:protein gp37